MLATEQELEERALADWKAVRGKVLLVHELTGYVGDTDEQTDCFFDPPIAVRVDTQHRPEDLNHWNDEHLDPYWDVEVVDTTHPQLLPEGLRSAYMFGISYNAQTLEVDHGRWRVETIRDWWKRKRGHRPQL